MTRGKHAARASKARAETAEQQLFSLQQKLSKERAAWKTERADLLAAKQQLQNRLTSEVSALAAEEVAAVKIKAIEQIRAAEQKAKERAIEAWEGLAKSDVKLTNEQWAEFNLALGLSYQDIGIGNRNARRIRPHQRKSYDEALEQLQRTSQGRRLLPQ